MSVPLNERLNAILPKVISDAFLSGSGIGNEIAFYIFDYPPEDELRVRDYLRTLLDHIPKQKHGLRVTHIDLFDFVMDYLTRRTLLDKALQMQREQGDQALKRALAGPLHESKLSSVFAEIATPGPVRSRHRVRCREGVAPGPGAHAAEQPSTGDGSDAAHHVLSRPL